MLCFVDPENIYTKIFKKYNDPKNNDFFNYFNRNWKPRGTYIKIKYIPEWNYFNIFDKKYFYVTNNISEYINKLLNNKLNCKHPTFENWKNSLLEIEVEFNIKAEFIKRTNYIYKLLLYFNGWSANNNSTKYLFDYDDIKKINTLLLDGSNMSGFIPLSYFLI